MESPTPAPTAADGGPSRKRPLELSRPEFTATEAGGAYHVLEMPKRHRRGHTAKPCRARSHLLTTTSKDQKKKRALEVDEPEFVEVEEDGGAYNITEMPKKFKFENMEDANALDTDHARSLARLFRILSVGDKRRRERRASRDAASLATDMIMHGPK